MPNKIVFIVSLPNNQKNPTSDNHAGIRSPAHPENQYCHHHNFSSEKPNSSVLLQLHCLFSPIQLRLSVNSRRQNKWNDHFREILESL